MAKKKNKKPRISESYISLALGFVVVAIAGLLVIFLAKPNNASNTNFEKINTATSTFERPNDLDSEIQLSYEVKSGDNLWTIAEKFYGSGYNWIDLAKANKLTNPGLINAGNRLIIPNVPRITVSTMQQAQNNSPSISSSSYTVQRGDYLWEIAIRKYGDGYKWPEIVRVNEISNPDLIYADTVLKLP